jgi:hypothetical protein
MPIFHDDPGCGQSTPPTQPDFPFRRSPLAEMLRRKASEESIRTELCEGPISASPSELGTTPPEDPEVQGPREGFHGVKDRAELIERLKKGESPTWLPNRHVGDSLTLEIPSFLGSSHKSSYLTFVLCSWSLYSMITTVGRWLEGQL